MSVVGMVGETGNQTTVRQQVQITGKRGRVADILKLAQHLGIGQDLPRVSGAKLEQPFQQGGLVHPLHRESTSRSMFGSITEPVMYSRQRSWSCAMAAAPGYPPK